MHIKLEDIYKCSVKPCKTEQDLKHITDSIEGGSAFYELLKEKLFTGYKTYTTYQVVKAICDIILGNTNSLFEEEFNFLETEKKLYSDELEASCLYMRQNGYELIDFYKNLRYTEQELYVIIKNLNKEIEVLPYSHDYTDVVGLCVLIHQDTI